MITMAAFTSLVQAQAIKVIRYLPADAPKYKQDTELDYEYGNGEYGKTELIFHCEPGPPEANETAFAGFFKG